MTPFNLPFINPLNGLPMSISAYVDQEQNSFSWTTKNKGKNKLYRIVLNPDCATGGFPPVPGISNCCSGLSDQDGLCLPD